MQSSFKHLLLIPLFPKEHQKFLAGERGEKVLNAVLLEEAACLGLELGRIGKLASGGGLLQGGVRRGAGQEEGEPCGEIMVIEFALPMASVQEVWGAEQGPEG